MKIITNSLIVLLMCFFLISCAYTISHEYGWFPKAGTESAKINKKVAVVLNNEFRDYVYKKNVVTGDSYTFSYGKILTYNVPKAFSSVFATCEIVHNVNKAENMGCDCIFVPKLAQAYTEIGVPGQDMPTRLLLEIDVLDQTGNLINTMNVRGASAGEISGGSTAAAYLVPGVGMNIIKAQLARSQNEAVDDLLLNLTHELLKVQQKY